ncbi:MAG: Fur family transcriptional regulator [Sporomusaceae bacterium]|nr:Fur family transcriptional regulator [Sporomusaceae bacterium]
MDNQITAMLRERGFKVTPQRLAIYETLRRTKSHPSAEMIFHELQPLYPTMSLATVYKTIEILREIGMIQVLNVGEDSFRYDAETHNHPHVRCMKCGRVDDVTGVESEDFVDMISRNTSYKLTGQQFYFYGVCPKCQLTPAH